MLNEDVIPDDFYNIEQSDILYIINKFNLTLYLWNVGKLYPKSNIFPINKKRELTKEYENISKSIIKYKNPFTFYIINNFFSEDKNEFLLQWLKKDISWKYHRESFFEQFERHLNYTTKVSSCPWLVSSEYHNELLNMMESLFNIEFSDRVEIVAHKLIAGQGIGIHTDEPHEGTESHRVVVQLNSHFIDTYGGHLIFFRNQNPDSIHTIIRPINNTAIAFELSSLSYHAVNNVTDGERYTLVFSFWRKDSLNMVER
ncbi:cyclophane-containing peptide 2OG-Fe(II) oxygenase YhhC [Herpetosiphon giganteus]|uniref:cyclophane-containing peptide 2OG-Fe(II) oxygenase YhhC n=1 Tax=Herpetosiphon giganteus TaxID=2029754 RepID=UPI00195CAA22|nr:cyclophane-containing peptide 2OG-Fe(II) oxygenase YhhC [Herpetosiphon giganteus]MBM7846654.1 hypothetical protein [Herpetosiphon giganteus]